MFTIFRHWLGHTRDVHEARRDYFSVINECDVILRDLRTVVRPAVRARCFGSLALGYMAAADLHAVAFGVQMIGEGGRGMGESLALRGRFYEAVMEMEHAIAYSHDRRPALPRIEQVAGRTFDEAVRVGGMTNRLRDNLYVNLVVDIGERAAKDAVAALPFPGSDYTFE